MFYLRLYGASFWRAGLRKGQTVHFLIPNNSEYHCLAIGVWLCEGICSFGDPEISVSVLKTQLQDTNAKFIICYEISRKNVYEALKQNGSLGQINVLVLEKANPSEIEDFPIFEENFDFVQEFCPEKKLKVG